MIESVPKLTHFDAAGKAAMVDVGAKAETARQAKEFFRFEPLGDLKLKGLTQGFAAYRVMLDDRGVPFPPES